jgi:hypothetical protein
MDDVDRRLSAQLPLPLAVAWRGIYTESPESAYVGLLALAENLTAYLAVLGIAASRASDVELSALAEFRRRATGGHSFGFGDWTSVIDEIQGTAFASRANDAFPIPEMVGAIAPGSKAADALAALRRRRNDVAHLRGPQGRVEQRRAFRDAREELLVLFDAMDFIADYPLRLVVMTQWDSLEGNNLYTYRDLMGDHPAVQQLTGRSSEPGIEAQSLYVVYRDGSLCLLRPMLILAECHCGAQHTFVIDEVGANGYCRMRALELTHTIEVEGVEPALEKIGLVDSVPVSSDPSGSLA